MTGYKPQDEQKDIEDSERDDIILYIIYLVI